MTSEEIREAEPPDVQRRFAADPAIGRFSAWIHHPMTMDVTPFGDKARRRPASIFIVVAMALACTACGVPVVDVGGNDNTFSVDVRNNTSQPVDLGTCSELCGSFLGKATLEPGRSMPTAQDPDGVFRPIEILSSSGGVLGCLPLRFSKTPPAGLVVSVSQMVPCGKSAGTTLEQGRDWPFVQY